MIGTYHRLRRRSKSEGGFTIVELMVASGVVFGALLALAYTSTIAFTDVALNRQRQGATALANQTMEQVRALPYDILKAGLDSTLAAADPSITFTGGKYFFGGEEVPTNSTAGTVKPLEPHRGPTTVGPTTYTVSVYPTYYGNDPASNVYRVTVRVNWANPVRKGVSTRVETSTVIHSPAGCLSTATHPFAGPCQPFLYGTAAVRPGSIDVTGALQGILLERATLHLAEHSSNMQVEQISSIQSLVRTPGATLDLFGSAPATVGYQQASADSDNDPATAGTPYSTSTTSQGSDNRNASSGGYQIQVDSSAAASTADTTAAASGIQCDDIAGFPQIDLQPCGSSRSNQGGTMTARAWFGGGPATLASVAAPSPAAPNAGRAFTNRATAPETGTCATAPAAGDGCVRASATRNIGTASFAGLPSSVTAPPGWLGYYMQLSGFSDSVSAESGQGTSAPSRSATGSVSYWTGAGYASMAISAATPAGTVIPAAPLTLVDGSVSIQITPSLTVGGTSLTSAPPAVCPAPCIRTAAAEATSNSPVMGTIDYVVTIGGTTVADLKVSVNLGTLQSKVSYKEAPLA